MRRGWGMMEKLYRRVRGRFRQMSYAESKVRDATSNEMGYPPLLLMQELAQMTYNPNDLPIIIDIITMRLRDVHTSWRHTHKALVLLDYMLKSGSSNIHKYCARLRFIVSDLQAASVKGQAEPSRNIRRLAKTILETLDSQHEADKSPFCLPLNKTSIERIIASLKTPDREVLPRVKKADPWQLPKDTSEERKAVMNFFENIGERFQQSIASDDIKNRMVPFEVSSRDARWVQLRSETGETWKPAQRTPPAAIRPDQTKNQVVRPLPPPPSTTRPTIFEPFQVDFEKAFPQNDSNQPAETWSHFAKERQNLSKLATPAISSTDIGALREAPLDPFRTTADPFEPT